MRTPDDPRIACGQLQGRRIERQRPEPAHHRGADQIALLRAAQRMVRRRHAAVQKGVFAIRRRDQLDRAERLQRTAEDRHLERLERHTRAQLRRRASGRGERHQPASLQFHQRLAAADLPGPTVGTKSSQPPADLPRQCAARQAGCVTASWYCAMSRYPIAIDTRTAGR